MCFQLSVSDPTQPSTRGLRKKSEGAIGHQHQWRTRDRGHPPVGVCSPFSCRLNPPAALTMSFRKASPAWCRTREAMERGCGVGGMTPLTSLNQHTHPFPFLSTCNRPEPFWQPPQNAFLAAFGTPLWPPLPFQFISTHDTTLRASDIDSKQESVAILRVHRAETPLPAAQGAAKGVD